MDINDKSEKRLAAEKTTAPPKMPGSTPQQAANLWGQWSGRAPGAGVRYKPPYSKT